MNSSGPNTEPRGTLQLTLIGCDITPPTRNFECECDQTDMTARSHARTVLQTPDRRWSTVSRVEWCTVSNAALRSNNTRAAIRFSSTAHTMSLWTQSIAVSVEWPAGTRTDELETWRADESACCNMFHQFRNELRLEIGCKSWVWWNL